MMKYSFRHRHGFHSIPAEVAGPELSRIAARDGALSPASVVSEARPESAPLHPAFEWRDETAAEEWRRHQARCLIASVQVIEQPTQEPRLAFVSVQADDGARTYQTASVVASDDDLLARALADARHYLAQAERRLADVERLAPMKPKHLRARKRLQQAVSDLAAE